MKLSFAQYNPEKTGSYGFKGLVFSGLRWQFFYHAAAWLILLAAIAFLSRNASPRTFGLCALVFPVLEGLSLFRGIGFDAGVVQRPVLSQGAVGSFFWLCSAAGFLLLGISLLVGSWAGQLLLDDQAGKLGGLFGLGLLLLSLGKVPAALLLRRMRYRTIAAIQFSGLFMYVISAVIFAQQNPLLEALLFAFVVKTALMSALCVFFSLNELSLSFDLPSARIYLRSASLYASSGAMGPINETFLPASAAKILGLAHAASLSLCRTLTGFIPAQFGSIVVRVLFPVYSRVQNEPLEVKRIFFMTLRRLAFAAVPLCCLFLILAEHIVVMLRGAPDPGLALVLQISAAASLIGIAPSLFWPVFYGGGRPERVLTWSLINSSALIIFFAILVPAGGLKGAAAAELLSGAAAFFYGVYAFNKMYGIDFLSILRALKPSMASASFMAAALFFLDQALGNHAEGAVPFIILAGMGCIVYLAAYRFADFTTFNDFRLLFVFRKAPVSELNLLKKSSAFVSGGISKRFPVSCPQETA